MEFSCIKRVIQAPKPEPKYTQATPEELKNGGPFDVGHNRTLASGETQSDTATVHGEAYPVVFDSIVHFAGEKQGLGRCSICRDNARERWALKATDDHGVKKWCAICLRDAFGIKLGAVI